MSITKRFSFTWRDPESDEWSYCFGKCIFVSVNFSGTTHKRCRFLVKPEDCEGFMPYEASGSGHVELFDTIVYLKHVVVENCRCDYGCGYFVWDTIVDRVCAVGDPCEA